MIITKELIAEKNQKSMLIRSGNVIHKTIKTVIADPSGRILCPHRETTKDAGEFVDWRKNNPLRPKPEKEESEATEAAIKDFSYDENGYVNWRVKNPLTPLSDTEKKAEFRKKHREAQKRNPLVPDLEDDHWNMQP